MSWDLSGCYVHGSKVARDCTVRGNKPEAMQTIGGQASALGERIVCRIPGLGLLTGRAAQEAKETFRIEIQVESDPDRDGRHLGLSGAMHFRYDLSPRDVDGSAPFRAGAHMECDAPNTAWIREL